MRVHTFCILDRQSPLREQLLMNVFKVLRQRWDNALPGHAWAWCSRALSQYGGLEWMFDKVLTHISHFDIGINLALISPVLDEVRLGDWWMDGSLVESSSPEVRGVIYYCYSLDIILIFLTQKYISISLLFSFLSRPMWFLQVKCTLLSNRAF